MRENESEGDDEGGELEEADELGAGGAEGFEADYGGRVSGSGGGVVSFYGAAAATVEEGGFSVWDWTGDCISGGVVDGGGRGDADGGGHGGGGGGVEEETVVDALVFGGEKAGPVGPWMSEFRFSL